MSTFPKSHYLFRFEEATVELIMIQIEQGEFEQKISLGYISDYVPMSSLTMNGQSIDTGTPNGKLTH